MGKLLPLANFGLLIRIGHHLNAAAFISIVAEHGHLFMASIYPSSSGYFQRDNASQTGSMNLCYKELGRVTSQYLYNTKKCTGSVSLSEKNCSYYTVYVCVCDLNRQI